MFQNLDPAACRNGLLLCASSARRTGPVLANRHTPGFSEGGLRSVVPSLVTDYGCHPPLLSFRRRWVGD